MFIVKFTDDEVLSEEPLRIDWMQLDPDAQWLAAQAHYIPPALVIAASRCRLPRPSSQYELQIVES